MFILTNIVSLLNKITYVTKSFILPFSHLNFVFENENQL